MIYTVFFNPTTGQVEAQQSSKFAPEITDWESIGNLSRIEVGKDTFAQLNRDKRISLVDGSISAIADSLNPSRPAGEVAENRIQVLRTRVRDDSATLTDMRELYRLENGL